MRIPELLRRITTATLVVLAGVCLKVGVGDAQAQTSPLSVVRYIGTLNDGGGPMTVTAPPGACKVTDGGSAYIGCTPVVVSCNLKSQASQLICNRDTTNSVIFGPCEGTRCPVAYPTASRHGITLKAGECIPWGTGNSAVPYAVANTTNDAGVVLDGVCAGSP